MGLLLNAASRRGELSGGLTLHSLPNNYFGSPFKQAL